VKTTNDAIEARLESERTGWRIVFGLADAKAVAIVDRVIAAEVEQIDPSEWR
jgi:hypothetical protein